MRRFARWWRRGWPPGVGSMRCPRSGKTIRPSFSSRRALKALRRRCRCLIATCSPTSSTASTCSGPIRTIHSSAFCPPSIPSASPATCCCRSWPGFGVCGMPIRPMRRASSASSRPTGRRCCSPRPPSSATSSPSAVAVSWPASARSSPAPRPVRRRPTISVRKRRRRR